MKPALIYNFDQIAKILPPKPPVTNRDFCFRPLPHAVWHPGVQAILLKARQNGYPLVLVSHYSEMFVKEALLFLGGCLYFDRLIFTEELKGDSTLDHQEVARYYIHKQYGDQVAYLADHSVLSPFHDSEIQNQP